MHRIIRLTRAPGARKVFKMNAFREPKKKKESEKEVAHPPLFGGLGKNVRTSKDGVPESTGPSVWLISFTDVMALMLTFFVLLFAMSNPKEQEWAEFTNTVQNNFNRFYGMAANKGMQDTVSIQKIDYSRALDLGYLKALMESLLKEQESLKDVVLYPQPGYLIVSLPEHLLFQPGSDELADGSSKALYTLAEALRRIKNRVEITGHADPRPVSGERFASNWELSFARAAQVAASLYSYGYEKPVRVRAAAAGRYGDLADRLPENERLDLSRRVDIVIMEDTGKQLKLFDLGGP